MNRSSLVPVLESCLAGSTAAEVADANGNPTVTLDPSCDVCVDEDVYRAALLP